MRSTNCAIALVLICSFLACQDDDPMTAIPVDASLGEAATIQAARASNEFAVAYALVQRAALQVSFIAGDSTASRTPMDETCGTVLYNAGAQGGFPGVLTLDYGSGCTDSYARELRGTIVATFSGPMGQRGTSVSVAFEDFAIDDTYLSGNLSIADNGRTTGGNHKYRLDLVEGKLSTTAGMELTLDETAFVQQVAGAASSYQSDGLAGLEDDRWEETRVATLIVETGQTFAVITLETIERAANCGYPLAGRIALTSPDLTDKVELDYGDGACDMAATVFYQDMEIGVQL